MTLIDRRQFSLLCASLCAAGLAHGQGAPVEGNDFQKVASPLALPTTGKVEVVEFFWYGCPHCNALEPALETWVNKLPAHVAFRRVPVGFSPAHETHQKIFYALEAMGRLDALHRKVFAAIHVEHKHLATDDDMKAFAAANGIDGNKMLDAMKSFSVIGKARQAKQLAQAYGIDGVPTLGIHGRFLTSPSIAGSPERCFAVAEMLIAQVKKSLG
jgi:thiol:disulfide interchange protein DsbA